MKVYRHTVFLDQDVDGIDDHYELFVVDKAEVDKLIAAQDLEIKILREQRNYNIQRCHSLTKSWKQEQGITIAESDAVIRVAIEGDK